MLGKASWYSIDVSGNDGHILFFYKKFHFCHLLPFAKEGQYTCTCNTNKHDAGKKEKIPEAGFW